MVRLYWEKPDVYSHRLTLLPYDMPLPVALGVVIWVVAISIAFGFYIPALRTAGAAPVRRQPRALAPYKVESEATADLDHAPVVSQPMLTLVESPAPAPVPVAVTSAAAPVSPPDAFSVLITSTTTPSTGGSWR